MLTKLTIRNFKRFGDVEIDLANPVVFVGPNDSGKTTALQALSVWKLGVKRWTEKRGDKTTVKTRTGVSINRRDLTAVVVPEARYLWHDLRVRKGEERKTKNITFDIIVDGESEGKIWSCGLEFDYANEESFYCRPCFDEADPIPQGARDAKIAFLPPMSGLADREFMKQPGETEFLLSQGRTAEVLRNLCLSLSLFPSKANPDAWGILCDEMRDLFGAAPEAPVYIQERGEITMKYKDQRDIVLDLSCSGRGFQQTLLILAFLALNPGSVLLLDEPDAHLEVLRQRQIYETVANAAREHGSQVIIASHSEVILNEAAQRDTVVAFLGKPHRIDDRGSQLLKSLRTIGFDQFYSAERTGWILYLEGSTDLAILKAFAEKAKHPAGRLLERPFVNYVGNQPQEARKHFFGLREAKEDLVGFALFDRIQEETRNEGALQEYRWAKCEIENYLCQKETLLNWAKSLEGPELFSSYFVDAMKKSIETVEGALNTLNRSPWSPDLKVSEEFLPALFERFFKELQLPNEMAKTNYHQLARFVPVEMIDPEVKQVLDFIVETAGKAKPLDLVT